MCFLAHHGCLLEGCLLLILNLAVVCVVCPLIFGWKWDFGAFYGIATGLVLVEFVVITAIQAVQEQIHRIRFPLHAALREEQWERARSLIRSGADTSVTDGRTCPLVLAAANAPLELVTTLLDPAARESREAGLLEAASRGRTRIVAEFLDRGVDPNATDSEGLTPLHRAVDAFRPEDPDCVSFLIENRGDASARTRAGRTPLHFVRRSEDVRELLRAGADLEARDTKGETPLQWALGPQQDHRLVTALLNAGANMEARDDEGRTPLHAAVRWKNHKAVRVLLDAGAGVDIKDEQGRTALHMCCAAACLDEDVHVARALLAAGADMSIRDAAGKTPPQVLADQLSDKSRRWCRDNLRGIEILLQEHG